ncbi:MAG TPA: ACP S-malonyltransferase [Deinococcales bacterium]|nr:ACP S-malonyltransferase [Deinococcales bacterium]
MIAALFPGQGSQAVGMGAGFKAGAGKRALETAFATLPGLDRLMFSGPAEELQLTENAQPALVAASVAAYRAWQEETGLSAGLAAGHSLGEFSALVAAGALELDDALRLVRARGRYMQAAVPVGAGAMAAVLKLDEAGVREALAAIDGTVEVANLNAPGQIVISGAASAVREAGDHLRARGARVIPLSVSAPFHCSLMTPARNRLERDLTFTTFHAPSIPVVANVTAQEYATVEDMPRLLGEQVTGSVRWVESVERLAALGATEMIEFGPGSVLSGLVKRIAPQVPTFNIATPEDIVAYQESHPGGAA